MNMALTLVRVSLITLFFLIMFRAYPQTADSFRVADAIAHGAPDNSGLTVTGLSDYFMENLSDPKEMVRAFYLWIAEHIDYDAENMFSLRPVEDTTILLSQTLETRKAVCIGYAALFHDLCQRAGIESYIVLGYTRQNGMVMYINHAWVVTCIDSEWAFHDPTWGAGFLLEGRYVKKVTNEYFMVRPVTMIRTHLPFDPMWQCLPNPISPADFSRDSLPVNRHAATWDFPDSIAFYNRLSNDQKDAAAVRRIVENGVTNRALADYRDYLLNNIETMRINRENMLLNTLVAKFNEAVSHYNTGALLFNEFINYRNKQFRPVKPDAEIRKMIDTCMVHLEEGRSVLEKLKPGNEELKRNVAALLQGTLDLQKRVEEQEKFVDEYLRTPKNYRANLFRR